MKSSLLGEQYLVELVESALSLSGELVAPLFFSLFQLH